MRDTFQRMAELAREGRRFVVATVVRTQGSTPQVVGARLLVDDLDRVTGTLGGGCVEGDAIAEARRVLDGSGPSLRAYQLTEPLAWDTGLVCGGTMWIHIEPARDLLQPDVTSRILDPIAAGDERPVALGTRLRVQGRAVVADGHCVLDGPDTAVFGDEPISRAARDTIADAFGRGVPRVAAVGDGRELLIEPIVARPRLLIAGGGHVALAIARFAQLLDYAVTVIDDREEYANAARFPGADVRQVEIAPGIESAAPGWNTFIVVATRGHKMDAHCVLAAARTRARYIGLLGSRRKTALIEKMLRAEGVSEDRLRAVHAPVGLDLGGRTPAEIALSVLAEISRERFGGSGRPLRE